jgi:hypothetical protein
MRPTGVGSNAQDLSISSGRPGKAYLPGHLATAIAEWSVLHVPEIIAARDEFDDRVTATAEPLR